MKRKSFLSIEKTVITSKKKKSNYNHKKLLRKRLKKHF